MKKSKRIDKCVTMRLPTKIEARIFVALDNSQVLDWIVVRAVLVGGKARFVRCLGFVFMVTRQLKLKLTPRQERQLNHWLWHLSSVYNWTIRRIENSIYPISLFSLRATLKGHGRKIRIPQDAFDGTIGTAHDAWRRCFKKTARKPRLKGRRNKLNSIAFAHGTKLYGDRVTIPILGRVRFHAQAVPKGRIGQMRIVKRASGWYLCLFIQTEIGAIPRTATGSVGIDPGFNHLLTLSTGEKVDHPRELEALALRLAQAQRGSDRKLAGRIQERTANQRKDRNHKLSRRLVAENVFIAFSKDNLHGMAKRFGKSVASSAHHQLRSMLSYKSSRTGDTMYVEPDSRKSTITCSTCGALSGPRGLAGLKVRHWSCPSCGTHHDRDINAAMNTLIVGAGIALERIVV